MTIETATNPAPAEAAQEVENTPTNETELEVQEGAEGQPEGDDTDEVEHEGKKYRVAKALKPALLMHADYTRKTQEVAETRKTLEERQTAINQQAQIVQAHTQDIARLVSINDSIAEFEKADWNAIANADQANQTHNYDVLMRQYQQMRMARDKLAGEVQAKVTNWQQAQAAQEAKLKAESQTILARDIKDWSPELHTKINAFAAQEYGFSLKEIERVTDPRVIRVVRDAFLGRQLLQKQAAAAKVANNAGVEPVKTVGARGATASTGPSDRQSTDAWMRSRNNQVRKQG